MNIKTIDVNAKEWFDKVNGNSYFSATVTIDYGMETEKEYKLPFQYGYGDQYIWATTDLLSEKEILPKHFNKVTNESLWRYCKDNNIILRTNIQTGCLKREL